MHYLRFEAVLMVIADIAIRLGLG